MKCVLGTSWPVTRSSGSFRSITGRASRPPRCVSECLAVPDVGVGVLSWRYYVRISNQVSASLSFRVALFAFCVDATRPMESL